MTTSTNAQLVNDFQTAAANTAELAYTSPSTGKGTIITNCTASNNDVTARTYAAYITTTAATPGNPEVPARSILTKETDVSPELSGRFMPPGSELYFETSAAASIAFFVSGKELI